MIETHPFGAFEPESGARFLILGSFAAKEAADGTQPSYDWFYAVKRNQFWPILEEVYGRALKSKQSKEALFEGLHIAIADIIYQCDRRSGSNLDSNLVNIVYATEEITRLLENHQISRIFFTSRFTEKHFRREFRDVVKRYPSIDLVTLPSPSPRYARMTKEQKVKKCKELLPTLAG